MVAIPPMAALLGLMGSASHGNTKTQADVFMGMMVGGYWLSYLTVPLGSLLIARQRGLVKRDLGLYHKFTNSTAHLNTQSLPSVDTINRMNDHHQLLTAAKQYFDTAGNADEKRLLTIPGFRGFKEKLV